MLTGLDILIARMKTNPEEFLNERVTVPYEGEMFGGKWSDLLDYAWRVADKDEREMLETARKEFYRDDFNERVMKRLAGEEVKQETTIYKPHWTDPRSIQGALQPMHPLQNSAQNIALQGSVIQGGLYDPNTHGVLTTTGGFQAAEIKQEGMRVSAGGTGYSSMGEGFWGGIAKTLGGR